MKTRILVIITLYLSTLLIACQPIYPIDLTNPAPILTGHEQANLAVVQNLYRELSRGNVDILPDVYAKQYTKHFAGEAGTLSLEQAYAEQNNLKYALPGLQIELVTQFVQGNIVVTEMVWTAPLNGEFMGMPTSSPRSQHIGLSVRRLQGGKIVEEWDLFDNLSLVQSLEYAPDWSQIIAQGPTTMPMNPAPPADTYFVLRQEGLTTTERWHQNLIKQLYEAYQRGDASYLHEIYADQVTLHLAGQAQTKTADELQQAFAADKQANPQLTPLVHSLFAQGDLVIAEVTWVGAHTGPYLGIPATNRMIVRDGLIVYRLDNEQIVETWEIWDNLGLLQSVGYLPSLNVMVAQAQE
ncbi:MAG: ester cyclase family protein [Caldilineaceae bacterium]